MELKGDVFSMDGKRRILIVSFFDCTQVSSGSVFDGVMPVLCRCYALEPESGDGSAIQSRTPSKTKQGRWRSLGDLVVFFDYRGYGKSSIKVGASFAFDTS